MRKKLREEAGLTLVEMLAATAMLMLLVMLLGTGLQMMYNTYQTMIARSEVELLLSTAVDALADDLRYARNVEGNNGVHLTSGAKFSYANGRVNDDEFTYSSDSYGEKTHFWVVAGEGKDGYNADYKDQAGQIAAKGRKKDPDGNPSASEETWLVLPTGAYGSGAVMSYKEYKVTDMTVTYNEAASGVITFTIHLTVSTTDEKISASTPDEGVTVRCLNPKTLGGGP